MIFSAVAKMLLNNKTEIEKDEVEFYVLCHPVKSENNMRWQQLTLNLHTLFSHAKEILQSCGCVGPSGLMYTSQPLQTTTTTTTLRQTVISIAKIS